MMLILCSTWLGIWEQINLEGNKETETERKREKREMFMFILGKQTINFPIFRHLDHFPFLNNECALEAQPTLS